MVNPISEVAFTAIMQPPQTSGLYVCTERTAPHLQSTNHVNAELSTLLQNVCDGDAVWSLILPLRASGGSEIESHPPYEASDHIFRSSINRLL
jgi:hypothetical protein